MSMEGQRHGTRSLEKLVWKLPTVNKSVGLGDIT
jgi:hypothetical protein